MKTYKSIRCIITIFALSITVSLAADPPLPATVAGTVQSLWKSKKLPELERYITALNAEFPNYVPAMLAESFYLSTYRGRLSTAKNLLTKVQQDCDLHPASYSEDFKGLLSITLTELNGAIDFGARKGISAAQEEAAASPEKSWEVSKEMEVKQLGMLPDLQILSYAPKVTLPAK